ncbi:ORF V: Enzymatic polyprotein [Bienertia sinuspersici]
MVRLPTLARPRPGEPLFLYIAVSEAAVSVVLLREEGKVQQPIYFVSHTLTGAESRYPMIEKAAYAIIIAARKLRPYIDSHQIVVLTDLFLEMSLEKIEKSGRLTNWALELTAFGIKFSSRTAIKALALVDFLAECSYYEEELEAAEPWILYTDGSVTGTGPGARVVLVSPEGNVNEYAIKIMFKANNNEAEYEAVIAGPQLCLSTGAKKSFTIELVPRGENIQADASSRLASSTLQDLKRSVFVEVLP